MTPSTSPPYSLNPIGQIQQSWQNSNSIFGKLATLLFYAFAWECILGMIYWYFVPTSIADPCYYDGLGEYALQFIPGLTRRECIFFVGTILYALPMGVQQGWNIILVAILDKISEDFLFLLEAASTKYPQAYDDGPSCDAMDVFSSFHNFIWLDYNWLGLILILTWVDEHEEKDGDEPATQTWSFMSPLRPILVAWDNAQRSSSRWEKAAVALFYSFVWAQAISAVFMLLFIGPNATSAVAACYYEQLGDYAKIMTESFRSKGHVSMVFFLVYANLGGIKVQNVLVVTIAFCLYTWEWGNIHKANFHDDYKDGPTCDNRKMSMEYSLMVICNVVWPTMSLICALVDRVKKSKSRSSGNTTHQPNGESTPLMARSC